MSSRYSTKVMNRYSLGGNGELDLFRDIIVLKNYTEKEKGVILIKYAETYDAFIAFFRTNQILEKYYIVLEMSWSGACDPSFLIFVNPANEVIVQTPEFEDFKFIEELNCNLIPVELGSGDWVDSDQFHVQQSNKKEYDLIMIANWGKIKNHKILFAALNKIKTKVVNVLLIGFPWGKRTLSDVKNDYKRIIGKERKNIKITFFENLPFDEVKGHIKASKVSLLLSKKEGANKAIIESFFLNVPAIVYEDNKGGTKEKINEHTGLLTSFEELDKNIVFMIENYDKFNPGDYIRQYSGSKVATKKLNEKLRYIAQMNNLSWHSDISEKVNAPNLQYKDNEKRSKYQKDYDTLLSLLRKY